MTLTLQYATIALLATAFVLRASQWERRILSRPITVALALFAAGITIRTTPANDLYNALPGLRDFHNLPDLVSNLLTLSGTGALAVHALIALRRAYWIAAVSRLFTLAVVILSATYLFGNARFAEDMPVGSASSPMGLHWLTLAAFDAAASVLMGVALFASLEGASKTERLVILTWFSSMTVCILADVKLATEVLSPNASQFSGSVELFYASCLLMAAGAIILEVSRYTNGRKSRDGLGREVAERTLPRRVSGCRGAQAKRRDIPSQGRSRTRSGER